MATCRTLSLILGTTSVGLGIYSTDLYKQNKNYEQKLYSQRKLTFHLSNLSTNALNDAIYITRNPNNSCQLTTQQDIDDLKNLANLTEDRTLRWCALKVADSSEEFLKITTPKG